MRASSPRFFKCSALSSLHPGVQACQTWLTASRGPVLPGHGFPFLTSSVWFPQRIRQVETEHQTPCAHLILLDTEVLPAPGPMSVTGANPHTAAMPQALYDALIHQCIPKYVTLRPNRGVFERTTPARTIQSKLPIGVPRPESAMGSPPLAAQNHRNRKSVPSSPIPTLKNMLVPYNYIYVQCR